MNELYSNEFAELENDENTKKKIFEIIGKKMKNSSREQNHRANSFSEVNNLYEPLPEAEERMNLSLEANPIRKSYIEEILPFESNEL